MKIKLENGRLVTEKGVLKTDCVLENGRVALEGCCDELIRSDHVKKAYLGLTTSREEVTTMDNTAKKMSPEEKGDFSE